MLVVIEIVLEEVVVTIAGRVVEGRESVNGRNQQWQFHLSALYSNSIV